MDIQQIIWTEKNGWQALVEGEPIDVVERPLDAQLVLYFAAPQTLEKQNIYKELSRRFPFAHIVGISSDGQFAGDHLLEEAVSVVAVRFKKTQLRLVKTDLSQMQQSYDTGKFLGRQLAAPDLSAVLLVADDLVPDANALAGTLSKEVSGSAPVFGVTSSAGFGALHTVAGADEKPAQGRVAALGFYGAALDVRAKAISGCAPFGAEHVITKAQGRELIELDGRPALEVYRKYMKKDTPGQEEESRLFPFFICYKEQTKKGSLRSVVGVSEETGSIVLGGNVQEGKLAQLMYAAADQVALEKERKAVTRESLCPSHAKGDRLGLIFNTSARKEAFKKAQGDESRLFSSVMHVDTVRAGGGGGGVFVPDMKGRTSAYDNFSALAVTIQEK